MTTTDDLVRKAVLSADGVYRYSLFRSWALAPHDVWIMLNPSTADAEVDDPTIRRCMGFSRNWGAGGIEVVNLFALRATDPRELARHPDPVGPINDMTIDSFNSSSGLVIVAWGAHAMAADRARDVAALLPDKQLVCLGTTRNGSPRHPLYVKGDAVPIPWSLPR